MRARLLTAKSVAVAAALRVAAAAMPWRRVSRRPATARCRKLFVVGCPRSGTTWVLSLLREHPQVVTSTESHAYAELFVPIATRGRRSVRMWAGVLRRDEEVRRTQPGRRLGGWASRRTILALALDAMSARGWTDVEAGEYVVEEVFERFFLAAGATPDHVLVEKTPLHLDHAERILTQFPEARLVEVLRDGRDVCVSMSARDRAWVPKERAAQVALWARCAENGRRLREDPRFADRTLLLRYEELRGDTPTHAHRLWAFAGLDADERLLAGAVDRTDFARIGRTGEGEFHRKGIVGDWVNHFGEDDEREFRALAGDALTRAGYRYER